MERMETDEQDPEHRKDEQDIIGKMMNMIGSLREELSKLWTRNAVLEKELAHLKPNAVLPPKSVQGEQPLLRGDREDGKEALQSPLNEGYGGEAVEGTLSIRSKESAYIVIQTPSWQKSCCGEPACEECDEFGKVCEK